MLIRLDCTILFIILSMLPLILWSPANKKHTDNNALYCKLSENSVKIVNSCPTNKDDFERASRKKNCEAMAEKQSCTEKSSFKYHCVINELEDEIVEVCAPIFLINGYCAAFNRTASRIQEHLHLRNGSVAKPFTGPYISTDAYRYPNCYSLVTDHLTRSIEYMLISITLIVLVVLICLIPLTIMFCFYRRIRRRKYSKWEDHQIHILSGLDQIRYNMKSKSVGNQQSFSFPDICAPIKKEKISPNPFSFMNLDQQPQGIRHHKYTEREVSDEDQQEYSFSGKYAPMKMRRTRSNPIIYTNLNKQALANDPKIWTVFKDAYEKEKWEIFNSEYYALLLEKAESIKYMLHGHMKEDLYRFVERNIGPNVKKVYYGFCLQRKQTVIVIVIDNVFFDKEKTTSYKGLPILYKQWTETTEESVNIRKYEGNNEKPEFKEDVHVKMRVSVIRKSKKLMESHSNIEIICASSYRSMDSGKTIQKENCILIYCTKKNVIPIGEMKFEEKIEEKIGGFKIDVREGFFYQYPGIGHKNLETFIAPTDRHPELKIGAEISRKDGTVKGTLGGFVKIGDHGQLGFITCAHVLHDIPEQMVKNNEEIVQPSYGLLETNDVCGVLIKSVHPRGSDKTTVDASLVQVESSRKPSRISFSGLRKDQLRQLGFSPNEIYNGEILVKAEKNAPCFKSGATTNFTIGNLEGRYLSAKYIVDFRDPSRDAVFYDQYVVSSTSIIPFASSGDSGAFVFQCTENSGKKSYACIGMVVGGTSDSKVVVTPIREVLNALDLQDTMQLYTFEDEQMESDEILMCCLS